MEKEPLHDCAGCTDSRSEGTHASHTKQHPCPEQGDQNCGYCFPIETRQEKIEHDCKDYPECKGHILGGKTIKFSHCEDCRVETRQENEWSARERVGAPPFDTRQEWEEEFDEKFSAFISRIVAQERQRILDILTSEMVIAHKEGTPTARLTSAYNRVSHQDSDDK